MRIAFEKIIAKFYRVRRTYYGLRKRYDELSQKIRDYISSHYHYLDEKKRPTWKGKKYLAYLECETEKIIDVKKFIRRVGLKKSLEFLKISREEVENNLKYFGFTKEDLAGLLKTRGVYPPKIRILTIRKLKKGK